MSKAGDVYENPVTGERAAIRVGKEESGGGLVIAGRQPRSGVSPSPNTPF